jgi:hypothetical protein
MHAIAATRHHACPAAGTISTPSARGPTTTLRTLPAPLHLPRAVQRALAAHHAEAAPPPLRRAWSHRHGRATPTATPLGGPMCWRAHIREGRQGRTSDSETRTRRGPVHLAYNPSYLACFFSQNSIFLSQKISQQCFSAGL